MGKVAVVEFRYFFYLTETIQFDSSGNPQFDAETPILTIDNGEKKNPDSWPTLGLLPILRLVPTLSDFF